MYPVAVDERVEFLSPAWVDQARAFIETALQGDSPLRGKRFSLSEEFYDAPPHLGDATGRVGWHVRLSDGALRVESRACDDADIKVSGEYQSALVLAQAVHQAGPEAWQRMQRELAHRCGDKAPRMAGSLPEDPDLQRFFGSLHDHMAARTVENPDLNHRLRSFGLEQHAKDLREQGYCIIERAATEAFADELRPVVMEKVLAHDPFTTNGLVARGRLFEEVALHPMACAIAQSALGRSMIVGAMSATYKETGPGAIPIHTDYGLVPEPFPDFAMNCVACWALEDLDETAGCTWVMPGSHRHRRGPRSEDSKAGAVPLEMPKGSVALWSHGIWHWQGDRSATGARVMIHVTYNRVIYRPLDNYANLSDEVFSRNPPAFSTLLGRDDPYGKSGLRGHDKVRYDYARRLNEPAR